MEENREEFKKVKYCKNCNGEYPCWCNHSEYVTTWDFIFKAWKNLKM